MWKWCIIYKKMATEIVEWDSRKIRLVIPSTYNQASVFRGAFPHSKIYRALSSGLMLLIVHLYSLSVTSIWYFSPWKISTLFLYQRYGASGLQNVAEKVTDSVPSSTFLSSSSLIHFSGIYIKIMYTQFSNCSNYGFKS